MKQIFLSLFAWCLLSAAAEPPPHWNRAQTEKLVVWLKAAADDGLEPVAALADDVSAALARGDPVAIDTVATAAAVRLVKAHRLGCCQDGPSPEWHIVPLVPDLDPAQAVAEAVAQNQIDPLFGMNRPTHPNYYALRKAYGAETDPEKRAILATNLDRWRWMPRSLGARYLVVNTAAFEATLWNDRVMVDRWEVVVGKTSTPTPVFAAEIKGVIFNPWWEIPDSIVAESVGALLRQHPRDAAAKGYVIQNGRYRQKPGPANSLGRMKLIMPNAYSVYLHDTPAQRLFSREVRAFSHGCVRVGDALGLATALLASGQKWPRERSEAFVKQGKTITASLIKPMPVYITYFTAEPDGQGGVRYFPDIYGRDKIATARKNDDGLCSR